MKYKRFTQWGGKDIGVRKFKFVEKNIIPFFLPGMVVTAEKYSNKLKTVE